MKPLLLPRLAGGILADEMGLGKTLVILATIVLNPRTKFNEHLNKPNNKIIINKDYAFSCLCGFTSNAKKEIEKKAKGSQESTDLDTIKCIQCRAFSHIKCVNYTGDKDSFLCLRCCTLVPPISSGCTLIVI